MRTLTDLCTGLARGKLDPVDLAEDALAAIAGCEDRAIFTEMLPERARQEAGAARRRRKAGKPLSPLDGVPIAWKDLFDMAGRVTTAGSVVLKREKPAARDAALVAAAKRAGLVSIGCTNMTEFAYSGIGLNPHYGTPRNPHGKGAARMPGGSSSGSAVAVARGLVALAIGTDTGGSIRIPAALNGIAGYKSSTGHYPMDGVFPLSRTLDTLGPLAPTAADCALADAVLSGSRRVKSRPIRELEILVPQTVVLDDCEPAVLDNFEAALRRLAKAGAKIKRAPFPAFQAVMDAIAKYGHLLGPEALNVHRERVFGPDAERMDARVVNRLRNAVKIPAVDLLALLDIRVRLIAESAAALGDRIVACPTVPHVAMETAPLEASEDEFNRANMKTLRNTALGNFLDWCGVALPSGRDAQGLPTGFLLSAPHGRDAAVLATALSAEGYVTGYTDGHKD
jgi:aspartyl-tRNA(Asn)/glutamyl-tRNA(Gln) amidotransferase subunit A